MRNHIDAALKILTKIYADGTYSNMAIYGENASDMTTRLVYGVLEQNVKIEFIVSSLVDKKPKTPILILLKIGAYSLLNLTDVPTFAIVSECVEVAKMNGKGGAGGFVNAVLKKIARNEFVLPQVDDKNYLAITFSKPQWFVEKLLSQFEMETVLKMLSEPEYVLEHIRINKKLTTLESVKDKLEKQSVTCTESIVKGLVVRGTKEVQAMFDEGLVTYQSPSSMLAVLALSPLDGSQILDLCSAPGGKAVYMAEICTYSDITACDIHQHRLDLIEKYKYRMHVQNVKVALQDASKFNESWQNKFEFVLVDAPCSCFGTFRKHPDVFLSRTAKDIYALAKMQKSLVDQAVKYVKPNGILVYSTCTLFKEENQNITEYILSKGGFVLDKMDIPFENDGTLQLLPHDEWDGFYIARFKKI